MKLLAIGFTLTFALTICVSPLVTPTWGQLPTPVQTSDEIFNSPQLTGLAEPTRIVLPTSSIEPPQPTILTSPTEPSAPALPPASVEATSTVYLPLVSLTYGPDWPMTAGNPRRTSWTSLQVSNANKVIWYRPIEAYISQNVQLIASEGMIYVSTARGLYALDAKNGSVVWRFDTALPLGNSPTVADGILYVGGLDRKLYALNAVTGAHLWSFADAKAGFDANPLVVNGRVLIGNRDGAFYAIGAHKTPQQGQLLWKYQTAGPIHLSAAFSDNVVYFAANDNFAYALKADDGMLVWKSAKLPGDGFHSYWPVVYQDKVIFSASNSYRVDMEPGTRSVLMSNGAASHNFNEMQLNDLFPNDPDGALVGPEIGVQSWSKGYPVMDASRLTEYMENNPQPSSTKHKPWRRTFIALNTSDGREYTFDSDGDGYGEYLPAAYWGTNSGNRYPPVVGPDDILYFNNLWQKTPDPQGKVTGWLPGTKYLSLVGGQAAIAEPQALSMGGNLIYRNLCCDRLGDYFDINRSGVRRSSLWVYNLSDLAPGYDPMWRILPGWPRLQGWYKGNTNSINGIYHNHGDQNPIIPYMSRLYTHRSNAIIAYGDGANFGKLPLLEIQNVQAEPDSVGVDELKQRLETEVSKMLQAGHLRPGYYNTGVFSNYTEFADYFDNPGDTLYTLAMAYPYLSSDLQTQTRSYLQQEFQVYFDPVMYSRTGWAEGAAREAMPLPPEVMSNLGSQQKNERAIRSAWQYPQHNFYAMWKYAEIFPDQAGRVYDLAKSKIEVPVPDLATNDYFAQRPYELNAYIAGYTGFLKLQEMAGKTVTDSALRASVTNELNRLFPLRATTFTKDTPYVEEVYQKRSLNIARNFMMLVPELGDYLNQNALAKVQEAFTEYQYVAPYWFVSRYEAMVNEGAMSPLYNAPAMFQAKAYILKAPRSELTHYLDVPAFERGDLFYIQNLIAAIQAP